MKEDIKTQSVDLPIVLGYIAVKDLGSIEKKTAVLTQLGYSNADMAKICNTTVQVIKNLKPKTKKEA